jgi:hypothetical protein
MKDWLPPPGAVSRKRPNQKWGQGEGGEKSRAEEWDCAGDRRDINEKCGLVDEIGGVGYEAGFVRRGGVGAGTVFGNSWSWKGE